MLLSPKRLIGDAWKPTDKVILFQISEGKIVLSRVFISMVSSKLFHSSCSKCFLIICFTYLESICFLQTKVILDSALLNITRNIISNKAAECAIANNGRLFETIDTAKVL
jgi:hypothetical protein